MQKLKLAGLFLVLIAFTFACGNSDNKETKTASEALSTNSETYTFVKDSTYVGFIAYKFTDKAPVKGWFEDFNTQGLPTTVSDAKEALENLSFTIPVSSLATGVETRDEKITASFFDVINTKEIKGKTIAVNGGANSGTVTMAITLNNIEKETELDYSFDGSTLSLKGSIDVELWDALNGINSLNEVCKVLHTGPDGVSKLWSEVGLEINAKFAK